MNNFNKALLVAAAIAAPTFAQSHDLAGTWIGDQGSHNLKLTIEDSVGDQVSGRETGASPQSTINGMTDGNMIMFLRVNPGLQEAQHFGGTVNGNTMKGYFCHHDPRNAWVCSYQWSARRQN